MNHPRRHTVIFNVTTEVRSILNAWKQDGESYSDLLERIVYDRAVEQYSSDMLTVMEGEVNRLKKENAEMRKTIAELDRNANTRIVVVDSKNRFIRK